VPWKLATPNMISIPRVSTYSASAVPQEVHSPPAAVLGRDAGPAQLHHLAPAGSISVRSYSVAL
jgi:hypothetical protein